MLMVNHLVGFGAGGGVVLIPLAAFSGGTASASTEASGLEAASKAFDGTTSGANYWLANNTTGAPPQWLKYDLGAGNAKALTTTTLYIHGDVNGRGAKDFSIQASNDNSTWTTLYTPTQIAAGTTPITQSYSFSCDDNYRYYRLYFTSAWRATASYSIAIIEWTP